MLVAFLGSALLLQATPAGAADVSSWMSAGGGWAMQREGNTGNDDWIGAMTLTLGVGTTPVNRIVVGGLLRSTTYISQGTDLGFAARVAQGSYARGGWGVAIDAGLGARWYKGGAYGRYPVQARIVGGMPWGVQLAVGADLLSLESSPAREARGFVMAIELDVLRFTVMRQGATERHWRNPAPAGGHVRETE